MKKSKKYFPLALLNALFFIAVLVFNSLASIIPLGGLNTGEISDLYPNLFVPSGLTFSIWGVIYILLFIYIVYNFVFIAKKSEKQENFVQKIGYLFIFSSLANICWILSWHYRKVSLSVLCMVILLVTLISIYLTLNIGKSHASRQERLMVHLPFSVYLGWISVATIANITALLVDINWTGFGLSETFWTILVIIVAVILGIYFLLFRKDIAYTAVIDWALLGIFLKRNALKASEHFDKLSVSPNESLITTVIIAMIMLSVGIVYEAFMKIFRKKRKLF